jgi:hypothetical protein
VLFASLAGSAAASAPLLGDQTIEAKVDQNSAGVAEAFQATASASGSLTKLTLYVDAGSTATRILVGVYSDNGGNPGTLLGSGSITTIANGAWNDIPLSGGSVNGGAKYWIAILAPTGTIKYRDRCCGGGGTTPSQTNSVRNLSALPATWSVGTRYNDAPLSAYGTG